jgi:hypothetical protein
MLLLQSSAAGSCSWIHDH